MPFLGSAHGAVSYGRARRGATWVNGGVVTTLAGNGTIAFGDGTGTNATFRYPAGAAWIPSTNIIAIGASGDNRIRLVTYPGGVVTTLAGSSQGFANGTGTAAGFWGPTGIAVLPDGNIVVGDQGNNRIRLVTYPGGVVTTLAGSGSGTFANGTGADASFNNLHGVAVLPDGNLVVADFNNHRIRLVTYPGGVVTTLAGSGNNAFADGTGTAASISCPTGVAVLPDGNIVVADFGNHCIRHITYPGGVVTTIAGVGGSAGFANGTGTVARFVHPWGVVITPTGDIVVSDRGNARVRLVTYPGGVVTTIAGGGAGSADGTGTAAGFNSPVGIVVVPSGEIVVVEQDGCRVRLIT